MQVLRATGHGKSESTRKAALLQPRRTRHPENAMQKRTRLPLLAGMEFPLSRRTDYVYLPMFGPAAIYDPRRSLALAPESMCFGVRGNGNALEFAPCLMKVDI